VPRARRGGRRRALARADGQARTRAAGADEVILYTQASFDDEARRLTDGRGVHVVYDSVGKTTFDKSLLALRPRGMLVLFGQSSGAVPPLDLQVLNARGSLFVTRPKLGDYVATRAELDERASFVLGSIARGELRIAVHAEYPLERAADAHRALESRATSGKLLLIPSS
jgi:NADPH2:quinone reductase